MQSMSLSGIYFSQTHEDRKTILATRCTPIFTKATSSAILRPMPQCCSLSLHTMPRWINTMAARTTFDSDERGSVTLQRLLPSFQRQSTSKASHQDRSMFHSRSVSAEPLLERSLTRSDFQSSISSTFSDAAAAIITPRSPTRSNGLPMPASWIQGKLTPISQVF